MNSFRVNRLLLYEQCPRPHGIIAELQNSSVSVGSRPKTLAMGPGLGHRYAYAAPRKLDLTS
jgi:hypothetical protein